MAESFSVAFYYYLFFPIWQQNKIKIRRIAYIGRTYICRLATNKAYRKIIIKFRPMLPPMVCESKVSYVGMNEI
jgi:hypothetical protein